MLGRLQGAWRELDGDQRLAGLAAVALLGTMFLPWYEKSVFDPRQRAFASDSVSAFGTISFVEGAIFLVSAGVLVLLFARGERRAFHLPGGDGTVIVGAGAWAALLLLWRVFDKPDVGGAGSTVGITWGFFFAFVAAAALAGAGWKIRAAHRPEPPIVRPGERAGNADHGAPTTETQVVARRRPAPRRPEQATEQLTLDDADVPPEPPPRDAAPLRPGEIPRAPDR